MSGRGKRRREPNRWHAKDQEVAAAAAAAIAKASEEEESSSDSEEASSNDESVESEELHWTAPCLPVRAANLKGRGKAKGKKVAKPNTASKKKSQSATTTASKKKSSEPSANFRGTQGNRGTVPAAVRKAAQAHAVSLRKSPPEQLNSASSSRRASQATPSVPSATSTVGASTVVASTSIGGASTAAVSSSSARARPVEAVPGAPTNSPNGLRSVLLGLSNAVVRATAGLSPSRASRRIPCRPIVGGSPFQESVAGSTLTADPLIVPTSTLAEPQTSDEIRASFQLDYNETGDGGDSDEEGEEINAHHDNLLLNLEEQAIRDEDNNMDPHDTGIPGGPLGWQPPGEPEEWPGYVPKFDVTRRLSLGIKGQRQCDTRIPLSLSNRYKQRILPRHIPRLMSPSSPPDAQIFQESTIFRRQVSTSQKEKEVEGTTNEFGALNRMREGRHTSVNTMQLTMSTT